MKSGENNRSQAAKEGKYLCQTTRLRMWAVIAQKLALLSHHSSSAKNRNIRSFIALIP